MISSGRTFKITGGSETYLPHYMIEKDCLFWCFVLVQLKLFPVAYFIQMAKYYKKGNCFVTTVCCRVVMVCDRCWSVLFLSVLHYGCCLKTRVLFYLLQPHPHHKQSSLSICSAFLYDTTEKKSVALGNMATCGAHQLFFFSFLIIFAVHQGSVSNIC